MRSEREGGGARETFFFPLASGPKGIGANEEGAGSHVLSPVRLELLLGVKV